jgi:hypothetical protein
MLQRFNGGGWIQRILKSRRFAFMIRFLFKQNQPKRYNYKPRFYDETREYLESRKAIIRQQMEHETETERDALRSELHHSWRLRQNAQSTRKSNINVLIIILILSLVAFFLLK